MRKALVVFVLAMFWCGLAFASDAYLNKNDSINNEPVIDFPSLAAEKPADIGTDIEDYCASTYTNTTDDWISYVGFNTIDNQSGQEGAGSYGDYTAISTIVEPGATYTLTVTIYSEGMWTEHVRAWIDWNQDEIFAADESYYLGSGVDATLTFDITIPTGGPQGATIMRIIEQYSSDPGADGACSGQGNHSATYGETEDYTVVVGEEGPCDVVCPPGGIDEGEPDCGDAYIDTYNGGCNSAPAIFQAINPGNVICGTSGTFLVDAIQNRDTDWFSYTPDNDRPITFTAQAEFPLLIFIIDAGSGNCNDYEIISNVTGEACEIISLTHIPTPGQTYWYWVGPSVFTGYDCPLEYVASLTAEEPEPCAQTVIGPSGDWNFLTSDTEIGPYTVYENFTCGDLDRIGAVRFWGLDLHFDAGWSECDEDPTEFEIIFYPDNGGTPNVAAPYCSYTVVPERTTTGIFYSSVYELIEYYAVFEACEVNTGWISIQGTLYDGNTCVFLWGCSEDGDMMCYQYQNGSPVLQAWDLSFELYGSQTSIENEELLPAQFDMLANYPNPFNAQTTIAFSLKESGNVSIDIFDVLGRRIDRLEMGYLNNTQVHTVSYDAGNLATGVYFYSLMVNGEKRASERFSLLK